MIFAAHNVIIRSLALAGLALIFSACTESGGGSNDTATAHTVIVSGTVGGTRIVAMNDNDYMGFTRTSFIGNQPRRSISSDDHPSPTTAGTADY